jgi:hypothetical protein
MLFPVVSLTCCNLSQTLRVSPQTVDLRRGVALTIPVGTSFQFRNTGRDPLAIIGVTMPPWPGEDEAMESKGVWHPHLSTEKRYLPLCLYVRHAEWVAS